MNGAEKNIALVCNPDQDNLKAFRLTENIALLLDGMSIKHQCFIETWPEAFNGFSEVWIAGGDGTLNWFINQYPGIELPLSIFCGGSGNDFHWMLYGDMKMEAQVEHVLQSVPRKLDAGICNKKLFLNGLGVGFDGAIVKDLLGRKKLAGKASYLLSILKNIVGYHEKHCVLEMEEETITCDCFLISVANGKRYGGGFQVAPRAVVNDHLLDVNIVGKISPLKRIRYLPLIEKGEHIGLPFVEYRQVQKIRITSPVKLHAHIDGEYLYDQVFETELLPNRFSFLY
jgi:YegS/Rv2252/BmrU family lipid kinase